MDRARGLSTRARTVWLVGAGGLIALLIAAVATLAYSNGARPHLLPIDAATAAPPPPPPGSFDMLRNDAPAQIVNEPPRNEPSPPTRYDGMPAQSRYDATPGQSRSESAAAPARYDAGNSPAPLPPLVTLPRTQVVALPVSIPTLPPAYATRTPVPMSPAPQSAPARSDAAVPKPPAPLARPVPVPRTPARVAVARKAKPAAIAADRPEAPPVDLDVALISAVVASRHRAEAAACTDSTRCPPKP